MHTPPLIEPLILTIRSERVILAADLALIYGVAPRQLNEQVKRNAGRFPGDFAFQLTSEEFSALQEHGLVRADGRAALRSQFAILKTGGRSTLLLRGET